MADRYIRLTQPRKAQRTSPPLPRKPKTAPGAPAKPAEPEVIPAPAPKKRKMPGRPPRRAAKRAPREAEAEAEAVEPADGDTAVAEAGALVAEAGGAVRALPVEEELDEDEGPGTAALSRTDPLARYMQEVHRHPVLSREEEHALAVHYKDTGDLASAYKLVASNLRLVVKIAYEYRRAAFNVLDLIEEGNVGLMHAVKKYDPYKGVKLSSYAAWWIRAYILRFIMDNWRMVKLGTTQAQRKLFFNLRKEQQKLAAEGYAAEPKLLAERLDVTEQEVEEMDRRLAGDETSLDLPVGEDGSSTVGERLTGHAVGAEEALGDAELKAMLRTHLEAFARTLEGKEKFIFENRLMSDEPLTLQQIGEQFGVSRERARQLEARLVSRIREELREKLPDFAELTVEDEDA